MSMSSKNWDQDLNEELSNKKPSQGPMTYSWQPRSSANSQDSRLTYRESQGGEQRVVIRDTLLPRDFKLELHFDDKNRPYTSRVAKSGSLHAHGWASAVGRELVKLFHNTYNIPKDKLIIMSSDEKDGLYVWVRSLIPLPKQGLKDPNFGYLPRPKSDDIEVSAYENPDLRLKDGPKLLPPAGRDQVIDI